MDYGSFGHEIPCCGKNATHQRKLAETMLERIDFVANEYSLADELDYLNYRYITIVRNPENRYLSHYAHDTSSEVTKFYKIWGESREVETNFRKWLLTQKDNYSAFINFGPAAKFGHF